MSISIISIALILALALVATTLLIQSRIGTARRARLKGLELRPNCLLTRHPLAFISGSKSFFHRGDHWNEIPAFLREHGYEVLILEPPPFGDRARALLGAIESIDGKVHLFADSSESELLTAVARARHAKVASLTLVRNRSRLREHERQEKNLRPDDLKPLETAIEYLDLSRIAHASLISRISSLLLWAHNHLRSARSVDALETGVPLTDPPWQNETCFLNHAISLAERDMQWSD